MGTVIRFEWFADFVNGQWHQCGFGFVIGALFRGVSGDDEEGCGDHGQRDVSIPCLVSVNLAMVESGFIFGGLEAFLDGLAPATRLDIGNYDHRYVRLFGSRAGPG